MSCDVFAPADVVLGAIIEEIGDRSCKDLSLQEVYALLLELKSHALSFRVTSLGIFLCRYITLARFTKTT